VFGSTQSAGGGSQLAQATSIEAYSSSRDYSRLSTNTNQDQFYTIRNVLSVLQRIDGSWRESWTIRRGDPLYQTFYATWRGVELDGLRIDFLENVPLDGRRHEGSRQALGRQLSSSHIQVLRPEHPIYDEDQSFEGTILHELLHIEYDAVFKPRWPGNIDAEHRWMNPRIDVYLERIQTWGRLTLVPR